MLRSNQKQFIFKNNWTESECIFFITLHVQNKNIIVKKKTGGKPNSHLRVGCVLNCMREIQYREGKMFETCQEIRWCTKKMWPFELLQKEKTE